MGQNLVRLGRRLREVAREEAKRASPPTLRGTVLRSDPLRVEVAGRILEEGEDDVEIDRRVLYARAIRRPLDEAEEEVVWVEDRPDPGDIVRVHESVEGEDRSYLISGRIQRG